MFDVTAKESPHTLHSGKILNLKIFAPAKMMAASGVSVGRGKVLGRYMIFIPTAVSALARCGKRAVVRNRSCLSWER
jgi:hypothetical protein